MKTISRLMLVQTPVSLFYASAKSSQPVRLHSTFLPIIEMPIHVCSSSRMTARTHVKQKSKQQPGNARPPLRSALHTVFVRIDCVIMVASNKLSIASPACTSVTQGCHC